MSIIHDKYDEKSDREPHQTLNPKEYIENRIGGCLDRNGNVRIFETVEIETINWCNLNCPFCPASRTRDIREKHIMESQLFMKIIGDLKAMDYRGKVGLYSNNEPFLDKRLPEFLKYAKRELPYAHHRIYTNGTLLRIETFLEAMTYLDSMVIDNYADDLELLPNIKEIYEYCKEKPEYEGRLKISLRKINEQLTTRGGQAPNKRIENSLEHGCVLPFYQLVIRSSGQVSLCCSDPYGIYTMGDLNCQTPGEVWYGKEYENIREQLSYSRAQAGPLCSVCDMVK